MANFATLDLNLLRVFDALLEERSVTKAGARLGVTQSAISHSLSRLRDIVGDELFTRSPDGMVATARARNIAPRLRAGLLQLQSALIEDLFEPATATRIFTIAADPYARAILLPSVISQLRVQAPGVELRIKPGFAGATDALDTGHLDFVIASYRRIPERFIAEQLLCERHVWALRSDHPLAQGPLTIERLAEMQHLVRVLSDEDENGPDLPHAGHGLERRAIQDDEGAFRRALAAVGLPQSVRLTMPDSYAALATVGQTDLAALVPYRMGKALAGHFNLTLFDPPYPSPSIALSTVRQRVHGANPATEWLHRLVKSAAAEL